MSGPLEARVGDADRDRACAILRERCVAGRLTLEEFAERTDRALAARTRADLEEITADLADEEQPARPRLGQRSSVALIGGVARSGRWRVPERMRFFGFIGGADLDLTEAVIESDLTTIEAWWGIGGVQITVPEGIEVDVEGVTIIGGTENDAAGAWLPGAPRVLVRNFGLIGGVSVRTQSAG